MSGAAVKLFGEGVNKETSTGTIRKGVKKYCQRQNRPKAASKFWSNFNLILFGKGREIHINTLTNQSTTLTHPCNNFDKYMYRN